SPQTLRLFYRDPVAWQQPRAAQARAFYRRIVNLVRTDPSFIAGAFSEAETTAPKDVIAFRRGDALVLVNTRPRGVGLSVTGFEPNGARDLLSSRVQRGDTITLPAYGVLVLVRRPAGRG
ncbi:MAG TPA: hypothetical protein VE078_19950, partial [Thermoanaerobaculia bacterium]|nr:hypothetical protein [Thermoanaerobaculia bacterium]